MMTPKQNALETIHWGKPEYIPMTFEAFNICIVGNMFIEQPLQPGPDPFGVKWNITSLGAIPDNTSYILDDITKWREVVKFPDVESLREPMMAAAQEELKTADRENKLINFYTPNGLFDRLITLMGYENGLMALYEEPEECKAFFKAMTDYKIQCLNLVIDAYSPDLITYCDDFATATNLFISLDTYRQLIKPDHARLVKAVQDRGVIFAQHTCGKCQTLLEDYVDIGIGFWSSAQSSNDLAAVQKKFKGKLVIEGGWDTSGPCSYNWATVDQLREEVRRNIEDYGKNGGFILMPVVMNERGNSLFVGDERMPFVFEEWQKYCKL